MVVRGSVLLGTAKTLIAMVADYSTEIVLSWKGTKEVSMVESAGGVAFSLCMYVGVGVGVGVGKGREAAAAAAARVNDSVS